MSSLRLQLIASAYLVVAMAIWGSSFIALKIAFRDVPPLWVIFARMLIGSLVFLLAWRWRQPQPYVAGDWKYLLGMAACEPCLYFVFEAVALQHTSAAQAGMITAVLPLMVAAVAFALLRERTRPTTLMGFLVALLGVVWLSLGGVADAHGPRPLLGNGFECLAMLCATGYTLLLKRLSSHYSAFSLTALQTFLGSLFFLPLALWIEPFPSVISPASAWALLYLGVIVTVGAYGFYNLGMARLPASQASAFTNLIPLFTLVFAMLVLDERLTNPQLAACGLVFLGVLLSQWRMTPKTAAVLDRRLS